MAEITFACPHCQQHIEADDSICGQTVECPACKGEFVVPEKPKPRPAPKVATIISASPAPVPNDPEEEKTILTTAPVTRAYIGSMIAAGVWSIIGILVSFIFVYQCSVMSEDPMRLAIVGSIVLPPLVIGGLTAIRICIETHSTEYKLTTQRFFLKQGLIAKHLEELELFRVKDITVNQGIFQRMLGTGSVIILSTDDSTPRIVMRCIAMPTEIKEIIRNTYRAARKKERVRASEFIPS